LLECREHCRVKFNLLQVFIIRAVVFDLCKRLSVAGLEAREDLFPGFLPQIRIGLALNDVFFEYALQELINDLF
jgi:hypothetical protein